MDLKKLFRLAAARRVARSCEPPRIGLAWTAMPKLVVRSAYGMFYQHTFRQGRENLLAENPSFLHDLTRSQGPGAAPFVTLDGGPPANFFATALPTDQAVRGNDPSLKSGNVQQWNFSVQRRLGGSSVAELSYVGTKGAKLIDNRDSNQANASPRQPNLRPAPIDGPDVTFRAMQEKAKSAAGATQVNDRKGGRWVLGNQGRVHLLMAAHSMGKIETVYGSVFEGILGERISTRPVEIIDPFPWHNQKNKALTK